MGGLNMRSKKEILEALEDFEKIPADEFYKKYGLESSIEAVGFLKALKWILKKEED
jgi:hypothetical protein